MQIDKVRKIIWIIGLFWALGIIITGNLLWVSWIKNGPTEKNEAQGIVYPYDDHGKIVFLNSYQRVLYTGIPIAGFVFGAGILFLAKRYVENKSKVIDVE